MLYTQTDCSRTYGATEAGFACLCYKALVHMELVKRDDNVMPSPFSYKRYTPLGVRAL